MRKKHSPPPYQKKSPQLLQTVTKVPPLKLPLAVRELISAFIQHGYFCWLAGGAVRDLLMGKKPNDFDIITTCPTPEVRNIARYANQNPYIAHLHSITLPDGSISDISSNYSDLALESLVGWAQHRDITVNSLLCDVNGVVVEPIAGAIQDVIDHRVRFIGQDCATNLYSDPIRILRIARLSVECWLTMSNNDKATFAAYAHNLSRTSAQAASLCTPEFVVYPCPKGRVKSEFAKLFGINKPNLLNYMTKFEELGIFQYLFPHTSELMNQSEDSQYFRGFYQEHFSEEGLLFDNFKILLLFASIKTYLEENIEASCMMAVREAINHSFLILEDEQALFLARYGTKIERDYREFESGYQAYVAEETKRKAEAIELRERQLMSAEEQAMKALIEAENIRKQEESIRQETLRQKQLTEAIAQEKRAREAEVRGAARQKRLQEEARRREEQRKKQFEWQTVGGEKFADKYNKQSRRKTKAVVSSVYKPNLFEVISSVETETSQRRKQSNSKSIAKDDKSPAREKKTEEPVKKTQRIGRSKLKKRKRQQDTKERKSKQTISEAPKRKGKINNQMNQFLGLSTDTWKKIGWTVLALMLVISGFAVIYGFLNTSQRNVREANLGVGRSQGRSRINPSEVVMPEPRVGIPPVAPEPRVGIPAVAPVSEPVVFRQQPSRAKPIVLPESLLKKASDRRLGQVGIKMLYPDNSRFDLNRDMGASFLLPESCGVLPVSQQCLEDKQDFNFKLTAYNALLQRDSGLKTSATILIQHREVANQYNRQFLDEVEKGIEISLRGERQFVSPRVLNFIKSQLFNKAEVINSVAVGFNTHVGASQEQAALGILLLLSDSRMKSHTVQRVRAKIGSITSESSLEYDFILLDSGIADQAIQDDRRAADQLLATVNPQAIILDPSNGNGYKSTVKSNHLNLYQGGWENLQIDTISKQIDLTDLPPRLQSYLTRENNNLNSRIKRQKKQVDELDKLAKQHNAKKETKKKRQAPRL